MLEELITSRAKRKLLVVFLTNAGKSFYVRELARKTGEHTNAVRRELAKLEKLGLVTREKKANAVYYRVDEACPVYEELKRIIVKTEGVGSVLKLEFGESSGENGGMRNNGILFAFVYGSVAKGGETAKSDVDLFVVGDAPPEKLARAARRVEEKIGREVNYAVYPPAEFLKRKNEGFLASVIKEKKIMVVGDENEFKRFVEGRQDKESRAGR